MQINRQEKMSWELLGIINVDAWKREQHGMHLAVENYRLCNMIFYRKVGIVTLTFVMMETIGFGDIVYLVGAIWRK